MAKSVFTSEAAKAIVVYVLLFTSGCAGAQIGVAGKPPHNRVTDADAYDPSLDRGKVFIVWEDDVCLVKMVKFQVAYSWRLVLRNRLVYVNRATNAEKTLLVETTSVEPKPLNIIDTLSDGDRLYVLVSDRDAIKQDPAEPYMAVYVYWLADGSQIHYDRVQHPWMAVLCRPIGDVRPLMLADGGIGVCVFGTTWLFEGKLLKEKRTIGTPAGTTERSRPEE